MKFYQLISSKSTIGLLKMNGTENHLSPIALEQH